MKKRLLSLLLCFVMVLGMVSGAVPAGRVRVHAATVSQQNIVDRANYLYNATWVCQKNVNGWRDTYTFMKGNTYHIPYGQPVYAGAYVGFGVSVDAYLEAAANPNSVFYTSRSNYAGKTSTYYATDCSAFVSWSWGVNRQTTATIPNISTYLGMANTTNIPKLQLGDCLNSNSAGHVVLVTGLSYNASGALTQIEITEQTPPQLKRSYFTPSSLANYYGAKYGIYRYTGSVPEAPGSSSAGKTSFGVEISAKLKNWVFNADYYKANHEDLANMTQTQLYQHFLDYGITEGRQASPLFSVKYYTSQNEDLKGIYGNDYEQAFDHFVQFGQYEASRVYSKELTQIRDLIFDPDFYCAKYPAATDTFNGDVGRLFANFIKTGLSKGYSASPVFDISVYISGNSGLDALYADKPYDALYHFVRYGQNESRVVSPILDAAYYTANDSDAAGMTTVQAMKHFLKTGLPEGRRGSENFLDEFYYFTHNDQLSGYTQENCYMHYLLSGYEDGLLAAPYAVLPEQYADLGAGFTAHITNLKAGLNWSISGSNVIIYEASDSDAQKWRFDRQSDGSYKIANVKYGTVLTTSHNGTSEGVITIAADEGGANQRWFLHEVDGYYTFRTACNKWITIGLTGGEVTSQNTIEMANYRDNKAQKYTLTILSMDQQQCTQHSYLSSVTTAPGCTTPGVATYTCVNCNESYTQELEATGHNYEQVVTLPGCTTEGVTTHTCTECGDSYTDGQVPAVGHNWQDATCTTPTTCTVCGYTTGSAVDHSYESVVTERTCTTAGYTTYTCIHCEDTYRDNYISAEGHCWADVNCTNPMTCTVCGETVGQALGHSYQDGVCTRCGANEVIDPALNLDHPSLSFESEILYNFYFTAGDLTDVVEMGMITFTTKQTDGTVANAEKVYPGYTSVGGGMYMVQTEGISAKNLGDAVYMKIYAKLSDGSYVYTDMVGYNAVVYAKSILKNSTNAYMKQLVVAMVNYGTEAQMYFGHNTSNPMNSFLTDAQKALVQEYNTGMVNGVTAVDSTKAGSLVYNGSSFAKRAPSVSFDGAFSINYYFTTANKPDGEVKLYYWTLEDYNAATKLSPKNATGSMSMTNISGNQYWGQVSGIAAKELDETVFVLGVYAYNGTTYTTGVLNYHIGKYCTTLAAKDTSEQQDLAKATAVYGHYAKEYFANI